MKQLVIGLGEIGQAIQSILKCDACDIEQTEGKYEVLHICFPYTKHFHKCVEDYRKRYESELVIIHSTVPIGTSNALQSVSSPCRGVHPYLEQGIRTFVKFFGGEGAQDAAKIFQAKGIACQTVAESRSVEALKLWDTTIYGLNILLEKEIYRFCRENNVSFELVYKLANKTYNAGYVQLGMPQYQKYILDHSEGKIGGHCIIPNCALLDSWVSTLIIEKNV